MTALPDGFDLDTLLAPCAGDATVGSDLREDFTPQSPYYRLRDARRDAREAERQLDAPPEEGRETPSPAPFWRIVRTLGSQVLAERAKDLEVAAWLTESLVRTDGLIGLAAGARLIAGLVERFWDDDVFPRPDEDGMETRVIAVSGLSLRGNAGTLIQPLRTVELARDVNGEPITFQTLATAETVAGISDTSRRNEMYERGARKYDEVANWLKQSSSQVRLARLRGELAAARDGWDAMVAALDAKAGSDSPSTSNVRDLLGTIEAMVLRFVPDAAGSDAALAPAGEAAPVEAAAGAVASGTAVARSVGREDLLRDLTRIAAWFRANEPQSPMAYTLDDAVRRGRMSWPDLLAELVDDRSTRNAILGSLGIKPPAEE